MNYKKNTIKNIDDIKKILQNENVIIFGLGGFPSTRSEIWKITPNFEVITLNKTGEFESIEKKIPLKIFSIDKERVVKKPGELINKKVVRDYIRNKSKGKKVGIYIYKSTPEIDSICKKNNWTLIANSSSLFEKLSSKKTFFKILSNIKYKRNFKIIYFKQLEKEIENIFNTFGKNIVIQLLDEGGGRGTFFFNIKDKPIIIKKIKERLLLINYKKNTEEIELVISPFIKGPALSIMGCVTHNNGTLPLYAQYQLIDIKEAMGQKKDAQGGFCGHDWSLSKNIPQKIHNESAQLIFKIGKELKKMGHVGIFGLDFMLEEKTNKIFPLEINVRILGSFPTITHIQYEKKEVPLIAFHLLDFLNIDYKIKSEKVYRKGAKREGAHIILFNPKNYDARCGKKLKGGIYKILKNKLEFLRLGSDLEDIREKNEFILTEGVPLINKIYKKNRKLLKIITAKSISTAKGKELNIFGKKILNQVYKNLKLKHYE